MSNNLPAIPMSDLQVMAKAFASSGLFGVKNEAQALALCLVAQSEGIHPARAVQEFHIVEGRPCLSSNAALSRFMNAGGKIRWDVMTDEKVEGTAMFNGESLSLSWDFARAKAAGLANRPNYSKFPRQMLKARCAAELIRAIAPGTLSNFYVKEEIEGASEPELDRPIHVIAEPILTIEAKTTAQETTAGIHAALAAKKHTPVKSQSVVEVQQPAAEVPKEQPRRATQATAGRDGLVKVVKQKVGELAGLLQEPADSIVARLTQNNIVNVAALDKAMFAYLQRLDELVTSEIASNSYDDSYDPFDTAGGSVIETQVVEESPFGN